MRENEGFRETLAYLRERFGGRDAISVREFAQYLGRDYQTTQNLIRAQKLPGKKISNRYVITIVQIAQWETST